jgi:cytochrome oxidase assembly protein ShyY1
VYRFLVTPRWLGGAVLAIAASVVMVLLGNWQLHRYQERSGINHRIDTADSTAAVPLTGVLKTPTTAGAAGSAPGDDLAWTKVSLSGRYDPTREIQARARTVNSDVGFEIVTPLVLADGTAVLVDRGFVPAHDAATTAPTVPPAPSGQVTVVGQIHLSESRPSPIAHRDGRLDTRRISVPKLAPEMPYPVYGAYVLLTEQTPAADPAFTQIPIDKEDSWQNAGYTVQWWLFAGMALLAYGWAARKEAQTPAGKVPASKEVPKIEELPRTGDRVAAADQGRRSSGAEEVGLKRAPVDPRVEEADRRSASVDRVEEADRRSAPVDRVEEADRRRAPVDRVEEADRRRVDRVEEADRKRAAKERAKNKKTGRERSSGGGGDKASKTSKPDREAADRVEEADRKSTASSDRPS